MIKILHRVLLCMGASLLTAGCGISESVVYEHIPSREFYSEELDIDSMPQEYMFNNILMVVDIKETRENKYVVWLGFYSKNKKASLVMENAELVISAEKRSLVENKNVSFSEGEQKFGLFNKSLKLDVVELKQLQDKSGEDKKIVVSVHVSGGDEKLFKIVNFEIVKRVEKRAIFPT